MESPWLPGKLYSHRVGAKGSRHFPLQCRHPSCGDGEGSIVFSLIECKERRKVLGRVTRGRGGKNVCITAPFLIWKRPREFGSAVASLPCQSPRMWCLSTTNSSLMVVLAGIVGPVAPACEFQSFRLPSRLILRRQISWSPVKYCQHPEKSFSAT